MKRELVDIQPPKLRRNPETGYIEFGTEGTTRAYRLTVVIDNEPVCELVLTRHLESDPDFRDGHFMFEIIYQLAERHRPCMATCISLCVRRSDERLARRVMEKEYSKRFGVTPVINVWTAE